ncbi:MAG TPA: L-lysine 6-transaminase [Candidatus Polarisedimenticolaceae bacterium]|nr:L-lysine 6-transaminase [Candidatus Polarisedimenticolaceae bacterium]
MNRRTVTPDGVIPTLERRILVDGFHVVLDLDRSSGSRLRDARDGKEYLDCFSFFASSPLGINHPAMMEPAFLDRLARVAVNKVSNADFYTDVYAEFVEAVDRIARPASMRYFFFIEGGALAVENALKAAFDWKVRLNRAAGVGGERGHGVLHLEHAFHGRSGYTLSLTNTADPRKTMYYPKFDWPRIPSPAIRFPLDDAERARLHGAEDEALDQARRQLEQAQGGVAAIILEPIQGEGGDRHFRTRFLRGLRELADRYEALLIFDEIQTGVGMTGRFWAFEHHDVEPDILVFAKKMQVGGLMAGDRIDRVPDNVFHVPSRINSTWGAHIVDMLRASRMLAVIRDEGLVERAEITGRRLLTGLAESAARHGGSIDNVRGRGLMCAIDLPGTELRDRAVRTAMTNGVIVLPCGERSIRFRPALTISEHEIDEAVARLDDTLAAVLVDARAEITPSGR